MPGLPDDRTAIPTLLARPGALELRTNGETVATRADLVQARLRLDESGLPITDLVFAKTTIERLSAAFAADPEGTTTIALRDFGIDYNLGPASTDVELTLSVEGIHQ